MPTKRSQDEAVHQDRRMPVARYVEFGNDEAQVRFVDVAEAAYETLVAADTFEGLGQVELRLAPPERRGLFRKAQPAPSRSLPTTPALARAVQAASSVPTQLSASPRSCASSVRVGQGLATVLSELALDLLELTPTDQGQHPAYRQTLRLAAELTALRDLHAEVGCTSTGGCVGIRLPESWGRRVEDVEIAEVRSVLHKLNDADVDGFGVD